MRELPLLLLVGLSACMTTGQNSSSDAGDAGGQCDQKNDCQACRTCAAAEPCSVLISTCLNDASCQAIDQCVTICGGDLVCQQQCFDGNPAGVAPYNAANDCIYCDECASDCAGSHACA
jgi:hypothetical protein